MNNNKKNNDTIRIFKAREHNLKEVTVAIPKNTFTVITGPSGSGKSSLALDVLYTEGKRRYMESLSSYARQFLGITKKPEVESIEGLCPAIAIEQRTVGHNPRSTVGTITEIYDYLRVLYARIGTPYCPNCNIPISQQSPEQVAMHLLIQFDTQTVTIVAPVVTHKKGEFKTLLVDLYQKGYHRFMIDEQMYRFNNVQEIDGVKLAKTYHHTIGVLLDKVTISSEEKSRIVEDVEKSFTLASGMCMVVVGDKKYTYSGKRMCVNCSYSFPELEPRFFSFNSPIGACKACNGLGIMTQAFSWWQMFQMNKDDQEASPESFADPEIGNATQCQECHGKRLSKEALQVFIGGKSIMDICDMAVDDAIPFLQKLRLDAAQQEIAATLLREIGNRLSFLLNVGLGYLTLSRTARTLSGGEGQRIRLATQIGSALSGVLYVLDEPSIGLHQRDNDRLIETLKALRDQGNTVLVVEHDIDTIKEADYVIDMGPGAGVRGGQVIAAGTPSQLARDANSLTGAYLSGKRAIATPAKRRKSKGSMTLRNAHKNNLKNVTAQFPLGVFCCVSGVSGSGKSTLIMEELVPALKKSFLRGVARNPLRVLNEDQLSGIESIESLVVIDQSPIGRTSRSNPATYLGIFDEMRRLFAALPESKARGFTVGRFSFNVAEGRCFECRGEGTITVSMQFLADVIMTCKQCNGQRYNKETLSVTYRGKNIAQILDMTIYEAVEFFSAHKNLVKRLQLMCDVGLDYLKLGQPSPTLSGGEAQRIKLVDELAKRGTDTLYILDEPTTGLHNSDIERLLVVLNRLVDKGNSMIVIEHNLDVLKTADYIIDMGPEGGAAGGIIVAQGTPEAVAKVAASHTGRYLKRVL
ncbi:MAG: excinuclease ABC subunit UvrA [Candidatus Babeliales bacterium]